MDLSIFIVSFNTRELTRACLRSLVDARGFERHEVIVVDNASTDGSPEMISDEYPDVHLVRSHENLGFARANNLARSEARGERFLLLNPDTRIRPDAIDRLLEFHAARPQAGITGGRTLNDDGTLNPWSCRGQPTPWSLFCQASGLTTAFRMHPIFDPCSLGSWQRDTVREVDVVVGCFLMIGRDLWDELGGFDPSFFMYGEETDLCLRARALGYRPAITPEAEVVHHGAASEPVEAPKLVRLFKAYVLLFDKHWAPSARHFGVAMLGLWAASRWLGGRMLGVASRAARGRSQVWAQVWARRAEWRTGYEPISSQHPASPGSVAPGTRLGS